MSKFADIQARARKEWEALESSTEPRILVGTATCGRAAGAMAVFDAIQETLKKEKIEASVQQVGCIGPCGYEPLVDIIKPQRPRISYARITPQITSELITATLRDDELRSDLALGHFGEAPLDGIPRIFDVPIFKPQVRIVLRNCGYIDPAKITHYIARGGYDGFLKAIEKSPDEIIAEVKAAGIRGRGGAGFPSGKKWEICRGAPGELKYIICNADEGDPGAFMNRSLIEGDPHSVLEGMLIAGYAIGASRGYIYIRAEYPLAIARLTTALAEMRECGLLGENILGSGFNFDITIKEGAGAFVCGEETALIASLEGKRGMPTSRPPYPAISGLHGKPTVINNVETLGTIPIIIQKGVEWYSQFGTQDCKGTKTIALAGKIKNTGLIEIPMGITLREVIFDVGGGIEDDKAFKAIQTGGPSGGCLPEKFLDSPVDYESLTSAGSIMGSGGMIVMDENTCVVDIARYFLDFTQQESCGKCVPCRIGTRYMVALLEKIAEGKGDPQDIEELQRLAETVKNGSLCGLGQTAPNPVLTTLKYFPDEYRAHVEEKRCPAGVCKSLISYFILPEKCIGCLLCLKNCPVDAVSGEKKQLHIIDQEKCIQCGICLEVCPKKVDAVFKGSKEEVQQREEERLAT